MDEKAVKSLLDIAPSYINFLLKFIRDPRKAFAKVSGSAEVSSGLTSILLGGVAFAYLILIAGASPELREDPGNIASVLRKFDNQSPPILGVFLSLVLGVVSHFSAKLYAALSRLGRTGSLGPWEAKLGGSLEASVNAALGFAAVYVPLLAGVLCATSWLDQGSARIYFVASGVFLAAFLLIYFPWSLSSVHPNTGFRQALVASYGGVFLISIVLLLLGRI